MWYTYSSMMSFRNLPISRTERYRPSPSTLAPTTSFVCPNPIGHSTGAQADKVWAITYLDPEQTRPLGFGSHDMDVLARMKVAGHYRSAA